MRTLTTHDGLQLRYDVRGTGAPVVLMHSFGFDSQLWERMGALAALEGFAAITYDARGHGRSDHPGDPSCYGADAMAADVSYLLDHLGLTSANLVAFSMGSFVALRVLERDHRISRAVLGGVGGRVLMPTEPGEMPSDPERMIREGAPYLSSRLDSGEADAWALAAVAAAGMRPRDLELEAVQADVLLLCGTRDDDPTPLAQRIPTCRVELLEADHGGTMGHPGFVPAILTHLNG